ncbi:hypothetical protein ACF09C_03340 [Streptomyces sp. NPDC014870]|uniref:hypothetical protein n=1 Tax=Streptomyces sp. NPDC014870 TaxID=3364925 RepID=UPI0036F80068
MTKHHKGREDAELAELLAEFSERRTYRPADDAPEPDDVPQAPSGTAMGEETPASSD